MAPKVIQEWLEDANRPEPLRGFPDDEMMGKDNLENRELLVSALENRSGYKNVFVQPVAGNAGTAIGAVLEAWHSVYRREQRVAG